MQAISGSAFELQHDWSKVQHLYDEFLAEHDSLQLRKDLPESTAYLNIHGLSPESSTEFAMRQGLPETSIVRATNAEEAIERIELAISNINPGMPKIIIFIPEFDPIHMFRVTKAVASQIITNGIKLLVLSKKRPKTIYYELSFRSFPFDHEPIGEVISAGENEIVRSVVAFTGGHPDITRKIIDELVLEIEAEGKKLSIDEVLEQIPGLLSKSIDWYMEMIFERGGLDRLFDNVDDFKFLFVRLALYPKYHSNTLDVILNDTKYAMYHSLSDSLSGVLQDLTIVKYDSITYTRYLVPELKQAIMSNWEFNFIGDYIGTLRRMLSDAMAFNRLSPHDYLYLAIKLYLLDINPEDGFYESIFGAEFQVSPVDIKSLQSDVYKELRQIYNQIIIHRMGDERLYEMLTKNKSIRALFGKFKRES